MRASRAVRDWLARQRPASVRIEVVASLGVVMALALLVLAAAAHHNHENTLRETLGASLLRESVDAELSPARVSSEAEWWRVGAAGGVTPLGAARAVREPRVLAIAQAARERSAALIDFAALWEPIVFASPPRPGGDVLVAQLSVERSRRLRLWPAAVFAALAIADALVFGAFGWVLLQRRVVSPLEALAELAREISESDGPVAAQLAGPPEAQAVADALSEMSVALAGRTKELRDAVVELRAANARLRETREGLQRAERLASVGRLAAGVAHEVGNPLGAILAFAELVLRDPGLSEASRAQLERLLREGERVRRILRQLLDLSRPVATSRRPLDLAQAARDAVGLVAPQRRYREIAFEVAAAEQLPRAIGDENAVQQVLANLLLNAAEAALGTPGARVCVALARAPLRSRAGEAAHAAAGRASLDGVACRVSDNGCGIPEEDRERIFDPFFTTRAHGEGTGLGLPNALRMAEEQGGTLELETPPPGFRTAFSFRLPAEVEAAAGAEPDGSLVRAR